MFIASYNKGFSMKFENGFEISVQWGTMNYCSRKGDGAWDESTKDTRWKSSTAEIAIFNNNVTDEDALSGKDMIVFADGGGISRTLAQISSTALNIPKRSMQRARRTCNFTIDASASSEASQSLAASINLWSIIYVAARFPSIIARVGQLTGA